MGSSRSRGLARRNHARINEQPAIAILRESRQTIEMGNLDTRPHQRLDQGIDQPLRQLMERHEAVSRIRTSDRWVTPSIAERHPTQTETPRPDRPEVNEDLFENFRCAQTGVLA